MVAAEFPVFMWVVRCLERPVDLGPMTDELLPRTWMPGCSSLLTSPPRLMVVILIAVIFLLFIGYRGTAAELSQWLAQTPTADLINK